MKSIIQTAQAPKAIGPYSQAVLVGKTLYCSGQIPLVPETMQLVAGDVEAQAKQVIQNLKAVLEAAGGSLSDIVKLTIYLTDLNNFAKVNDVMAKTFSEPYPARATIGVSALPKNAEVEIEAIAALN